jgi:uncharacterized radical SAM superfamily Fe-S cluster-containing enzyme
MEVIQKWTIYEVQSRRIVEAVRSLCPICVATFDSSRAPIWVRFLIKDGSIMLTKAYPECNVSEVANWSDETAASNARSRDWRFSQESRIALRGNNSEPHGIVQRTAFFRTDFSDRD